MIADGTPPDLVFDLTFKGSSSDVTQSITASLGLPTVAATFADEGGLKYGRLFIFFILPILILPENGRT